jgi:polyhydroxyalkanoate synthesis regulator protein
MTRLIKKYKNRQLYDAEGKTPVTFAELAKGIEAGQSYKIADNETARDITLQTYVQVLYEQIRTGRPVREYDEVIRQIALKGGEK